MSQIEQVITVVRHAKLGSSTLMFLTFRMMLNNILNGENKKLTMALKWLIINPTNIAMGITMSIKKQDAISIIF
jgi:hypothetical protein